VLPSDPVLQTPQIIEGLCEGPRSLVEESGRVRLIAQPLAVPLGRVA
jgi:hypothetical protein